jgi:hypothetical protein
MSKPQWHRCADGSYVLQRPYRWLTHDANRWVVRKWGPAIHTLSGDWNDIGSHRTLREAKKAAEGSQSRKATAR